MYRVWVYWQDDRWVVFPPMLESVDFMDSLSLVRYLKTIPYFVQVQHVLPK